MADRFLIAPFKSGLVNNMEPFLTPEDSFEELKNAYVFRGKVKKRFGSAYTGSSILSEVTAQLNSRLRIALTGGAAVGITDGAGDANGTVPGATFKVGQLFSIGTEIFTVSDTGTPANMLTTGAATTATFNTTTGAYVFAGATPTTQIYFYPAEPVMGFAMYESGPINNHTAYAYDTQFIYKFSGSSWVRVGAQTYTSSNKEYFWTSNWDGITPNQTAMFSTNFNFTTPDNMYYTVDGTTFTAFKPKFLAAGTADQNIVVTCRIILPFKNRLILLNTYEVDAAAGYTTYTNRCRYSQNGSPIDEEGYAWLEPEEDNYGGAGFIDAPTEESIISAEFIRDRLIVYFERSTWELAYTGNEVLPFVWQKLNTELGSESTFSSVPFDKFVLNIGTTGIHACNGVNVERIDNKIPDEIFKSLNVSDAVVRVHGIRDYDTELVYWTLPRQIADDTNYYADKVLVYNYANKTWSFNDDSITAFGYFEQSTGETWADDYQIWADDASTWDSGTKIAQHRQVVAGNQQGFVFQLNKNENSNESVLQITNTVGNNLEIRNHNLATGTYINLNNLNGLTGSPEGIYRISKVDENNVSLDPTVIELAGTYTGGGTAALVSNISIKSKQWNPYITGSKDFYLDNISFCLSKTENGQISVKYFPSSTSLDLSDQGDISGANWGSYILETNAFDLNPLEALQDRLWHTVYFQGYGTSVQIQLTFTDAQIIDEDIVESSFELQGLILQTRKGNNIG